MTPWQSADRPRARVGRAIEVHDSIPSTNDRARELIAAGIIGRAVVAEVQTAGRGRRGRTWASPPGANLTLSIGIDLGIRARDAWQLAAAAGLAVRDACLAVAPLGLKWPNDIVSAEGHKVGGVLIETSIDGEVVTSAVIGIGLNVNWPRSEMPDEIRDHATSLAELNGRPIARETLLADLLDALDREVVAMEGGRSPLDRYRAACTTLGAEIEVDTGDRRVVGRAIDLDAGGALVVESGGRRERLASGEIVRLRAVTAA
ncbi:MAG: biotin--[acetyl-CoA-carboxylase] ligase [Candidatus Limnocylindria bacterium]